MIASFEAACVLRERNRLIDQVQSKHGAKLPRDPAQWQDTAAMRAALGKAAKGRDWYKRQDRGRKWVAAIAEHLDDPSVASADLMRQLTALRTWIDDG